MIWYEKDKFYSEVRMEIDDDTGRLVKATYGVDGKSPLGKKTWYAEPHSIGPKGAKVEYHWYDEILGCWYIPARTDTLQCSYKDSYLAYINQ